MSAIGRIGPVFRRRGACYLADLHPLISIHGIPDGARGFIVGGGQAGDKEVSLR